jgi:hypothetical protein
LTVLTIVGLAIGLSGCGDAAKDKTPKANGKSAIKPNLGHKEDRDASSKDPKTAAPKAEDKKDAPKAEPKAEVKEAPKAEEKKDEPKPEPKAEDKSGDEKK